VHQLRDELEEADRLRQQGKLDRAEAICNGLLRRFPDYVAALHTLGLVYLDKHNFDRALDSLVRALMLDPANWMTLTALSLAYLRLGATAMAAQTLERALIFRPQDAAIFASLGEIHRQDHEYEAAGQAYRQALAIAPDLASASLGLALCLAAIGDNTGAAGVLEEAYRRGHRSLNLLHIMTTLPADTVRIDLLGALDALTAGSGDADAEYKNTFGFVRASTLHLAGRHAESWRQLVEANRQMAARHLANLKAAVARRGRSLSQLRATSLPAIGPGGDGPMSLFILGPSRSGKTSMERLVGSLGGVKTGDENPIVENALRRTFQAAAIPASIFAEDLPAYLYPAFRECYRTDLARRAGSASLFTSTQHARIHDAGLIATLIPNSRFLLMKRDRDDVALRIYMTKYLDGHSHAYDIKALFEYLRWYDEMINLTAEKMPGIVKVVSYESMIADPAATLQEAASFCGLRVENVVLPTLGDDRGCAGPYREFLSDAK
jgi:tetratricopeptide (TPR) repeat protein